MTHDDLVAAIRQFIEHDMLLEDETASEALFELEQLVPPAGLGGIIFYEMDGASFDEIATEALYREQLWTTGGRQAVRDRRRSMMEAVLANDQSSVAQRYAAMATLKGLDRVEAEERSEKPS